MKTQQRIERVISGDMFPRYQGEDPQAFWKTIEQHAANLRRGGVTHVRINDAPLSISEVMEPENSYMRFTTYGYAPDKYVSSTLNEGIYHPSILELNRQALLWQAKLARQFGFRCWIRCIEMTLMPESFFQRHPALRGPRVDNPTASTSPRYALCPMLPEVQDHYRQLIIKLMQLCPEIDEMHIFSCDSGGGFCYADHLYSGANGPVHCRETPAGKQAQVFSKVLLDGARTINPQFRVVMTSGLMPRERVAYLDGAPEGLAASIFGAFAWGGGMEDRWQNFAVGPAIRQPAVRAEARHWAQADMEARAKLVTSRGGILYASYNPDYYTGPSDAPRPYETHEIMMQYLNMGVRNIIGGAWGTPYHANGGIFVQAIADGPMDTPQAVRKLAASWVGEARADRLCKVWRLSDDADRGWLPPPWCGFSAFTQPLLMKGPIVPDASRLGAPDLDYFLTSVMRDEQKMKTNHGGVWRFCHCRDAIKREIIAQAETIVLPADDEALALLAELLQDQTLSPEQRECLNVQAKEIGIHRCYMARVQNWFQAAFYVLAGAVPYPGLPKLSEIIGQEIDNSQRWYELEGGTGRLDSPRQQLMIAHRNDPPAQVDLHEFPFSEYRGLSPWPGAHLDPATTGKV